MSQRDIQESFEELSKWLEDIRRETSPMIVEGVRDEASLRALGVFGEIIQLNRGESMVVFCEKLSMGYKKAIVLTDWDRTGGHLARILSDGLRANGVSVDMDYRARLAKICRREAKDVEGVSGYYNRLRDKLGLHSQP